MIVEKQLIARRAEAVVLYREGYSLNQVGQMLGVRAETILRDLRIAGEPTRAKHKPAPKTRKRETGLKYVNGNKKQAKSSVEREVRAGRIPHPNTLQCETCGHAWSKGEWSHHYHHYLGYSKENFLSVKALCRACHVGEHRHAPACRNGHPFTEETTGQERRWRRCKICKKLSKIKGREKENRTRRARRTRQRLEEIAKEGK